jgi:protein-disulfide isomerase
MPTRVHHPAVVGLVAAISLSAAAPWTVQAAEVVEGSVGSDAAPVTMIEYSSLTCPHCAAFHQETLPGLKARFIDAGKVRLVLRDFPLDQVALKGAVLAHCAGPARYPTFVDVFFQQQASWVQAPDPVAALKQLARLGGLGEAEADACLADKAMEDAVLQMRLKGQQQFNIQSTPTFILGGKTVAGNKTVDEFAAIIDPLLAEAGSGAAPAQPETGEPATPGPTAAPAPAPAPVGVLDRAMQWLQSLFG